jgi:hypothetical protein
MRKQSGNIFVNIGVSVLILIILGGVIMTTWAWPFWLGLAVILSVIFGGKK